MKKKLCSKLTISVEKKLTHLNLQDKNGEFFGQFIGRLISILSAVNFEFGDFHNLSFLLVILQNLSKPSIGSRRPRRQSN